MKLETLTCTEFLDVLASKAPVPGGGGASALVGAVGVACLLYTSPERRRCPGPPRRRC